MAQILIIEDEVLLAKSLARALANRGHDCVCATSSEEGLKLLEQMPTDIVLLDLQLPGMSGLEAIKLIRQYDSNISVIIATAYATMASAIESMRSGACDFLRKPLDTEEVALAVERAVANARLKQTVSYYHDLEAERIDSDRLICKSETMKTVAGIVERLTAMDLDEPSNYPPVLILGETGTGKDLIARIIHYRGKLSEGPFIEVNCTTLPKGLEEAELFGYEKGSFTGAEKSKRGLFEAAIDGTIFLNEIGDLTMEAQVKLLQVIEQKILRRIGGLRDLPVNVRILAATNRNLKDSQSFREDLFYRLNNIVIEMPPLCRRKEDIIILAENFLRDSCIKYNVGKQLSENARKALTNYSWPGNVRELRQLMERVTFLSHSQLITPADLQLPEFVKNKTAAKPPNHLQVNIPETGISLEEIEKGIIIDVLRSCNGNVSEAARKLQLGREALRYRIKKYEIASSIEING